MDDFLFVDQSAIAGGEYGFGFSIQFQRSLPNSHAISDLVFFLKDLLQQFIISDIIHSTKIVKKPSTCGGDPATCIVKR